MKPRGIRNNNPGNIRHGDNWQGLSAEQLDSDFCTFTTPEYGIRAMCKILLNYERRHGLNTVRGIISRWAPPVENNTESYVQSVARALNVDADKEIKVDDYLDYLVPAIIRHENGQQPYSPEVIRMGINMAL